MANVSISNVEVIVVNTDYGLCALENKILVPIDGYRCDVDEFVERYEDEVDRLEVFCDTTSPYQKVEGLKVRMYLNK